MRRILKRLTLILLVVTAYTALCFYVFYMYPRYVVPVLMYHSISDDKTSRNYVTPENFLRQIRFLRAARYSIISLDELVEGIKNGKRFGHKTVVITFDDGYEDNYTKAFPVLTKFDALATIFIITDYVDTNGYLKWDQIREMAAKKIDFGGHTKTDQYLPSVENEMQLQYEIKNCKEDIEEKIGKKIKYFAYPIGGFNEEVKDIIKHAGYKAACTTNRGFDKFEHDLYELNRIKVTNSDMNKPLHFRAKLSGYYNLFRSLKSGD